MATHYFDLKGQSLGIKEEIDEAIDRIIYTNSSFILGQELELFEKEFASYCGAKYGIGVGSGTCAISLALLAAGVKPGDEVITVPNTAIPTVSAITSVHAVPILVDVDETYQMNPAMLEKAITNKTKAIVPVHLYGHPADMVPIMETAQKHGLKVVEDCAQAAGTLYNGKHVGTFGDFGAFSFYPTKNLGAFGDGGMVITNSHKGDEQLRLLRNYGQKERYSCDEKGVNSRLDELQAAILRIKLKHLDCWNEKRRTLAKLYNQLLKEVNTPPEKEYAKSNYHLYVIRSQKRDELREFLAKKGIGTQIHYPIPIHKQKAFAELSKCQMPNAEKFSKEIISLPMYPELTKEEIEQVAEAINEFCKGGQK